MSEFDESDETNELDDGDFTLSVLSDYKINFEINSEGNKILIDRGAFDKIYLGNYLGKKVAVKEYYTVEEFENSNSLYLGKNCRDLVSHPNILKYIGFAAPLNGRFWVVTEFVKGGNLEAFLSNHEFSCEKSTFFYKLLICVDIARALQFLKEKEICHGNLKPKNVIVENEKGIIAKLCEFSVNELGVVPMETSLTMKGSFGAVAPEIGSPRKKSGPLMDIFHLEKISYSSDVYSFGSVVYSIFVGEPATTPLIITDDDFENVPKGIKEIVLLSCFEEPEKRLTIDECVEKIEIILGVEENKNLLMKNGFLWSMSQPMRAVKMFQLATEEKTIESVFQLGMTFLEKSGVEKEKGMMMIKVCAENNHPIAQFKLGEFFSTGEFGLPIDERKALDWFERAHKMNKDLTKNMVDQFFERTKRHRDFKTVVRYLLMCVDHGHSKAQNSLGFCYDNELGGLKHNMAMAVEMYMKSAEQGYQGGMYNLGFCYQRGKGVEKDVLKAFDLYTAAMKLNHPKAKNNLGVLYRNGVGVENPDVEKAFTFFSESSQQGYVNGTFNLGDAYQNGIGCERDSFLAVQCFETCAAARDPLDDRKEHMLAKRSRKRIQRLSKQFFK